MPKQHETIPTMSIDQIISEPVSRLVGDSAHLHLWTTNAFLESAFAKPTFRRNDIRSWVVEPRRRQSEKLFRFRQLIEAVSPGPYLELVGRVEQPNSGSTIYCNEIERRLF